MRRILISGLGFCLAAVLLVHLACSTPAAPARSAPTGKSNPLVFVFLRVDTDQHLAILRPMIAPDIGVQLDSGSRQLEKRTVLQCRSAMREHDALIDGQISKFSEMLLDCGEYKFVVKAVDFSPQR
jgi:hypothetical protein